MGIVERIKIKIDEKSMKISHLEKEAGLGNGTIRRWNEKSPSCDKVEIIANLLNVTTDWLITGKEMSLTPAEQKIIEAYRQARPSMREAAEKILDVESSQERSSTSRTG